MRGDQGGRKERERGGGNCEDLQERERRNEGRVGDQRGRSLHARVRGERDIC